MASGKLSTTVHWDACVKSQPSPADGNYEVETISDNFITLADKIELALKAGDAFNLADADALTWKWQDPPAGYFQNVATGQMDIDTTLADTLFIKCLGTHTSDPGIKTAFLSQYFSGDIAAEIQLGPPGPDVDHSCWFIVYMDSHNWYGIKLTTTGLTWNTLTAILYMTGLSYPTTHTLSYSPPSTVYTRLRRVGARAYVDWKAAPGDSWICFDFGSFGTVPPIAPLCTLWHSDYAKYNIWTEASFNDFRLTAFTPPAGGRRATGILTSPSSADPSFGTTTKPTLEWLTKLSIGILGDTNNKITKVEVLRASDDAILTTHISDIYMDTDLVDTDFDHWFGVTATDIKLRLTFAGDGLDTPVLSSVAWTSIEPSPFVSRLFDRYSQEILIDGTPTKARIKLLDKNVTYPWVTKGFSGDAILTRPLGATPFITPDASHITYDGQDYLAKEVFRIIAWRQVWVEKWLLYLDQTAPGKPGGLR